MTYFRKNDLQELIETLTISEYRYCLNYLSKLTNKDDAYFLDLLKAYRDNKSEVFQKIEVVSKQALTNAKRRLYRHVLHCLNQYQQSEVSEGYIHTLLSKVEVLYERGLPSQGMVLLYKALNLAKKNEQFGLIFQILNWERKLNVQLSNSGKTSNQINAEEQATLEKYNQIVALGRIYNRIKEVESQFGYAKGAVRKELDAIMDLSEILAKEKLLKSQRAKHYYHLIYGLYYHRIIHLKQAYQHSKILLTYDKQIIPPEEYLEGIIEHIIYCMSLAYFKEMEKWLAVANRFIQHKGIVHSVPVEDFVFYAQTCYHLIMYIYTGAIEKLTDVIGEAEKKLRNHHKRFSTEKKLVIIGNLRNAYIAVGDTANAEWATEEIMNMDVSLLRRDVVNDIFLGRALLFLMTENYDLISWAAQAAYRQYTKTKDSNNQFEPGLKVASILMKDYNYQDSKVQKQVLIQVRHILVQQIGAQKGLNNFHEGFSFYILWVDSILEEKPFYQVAQNWFYKHFDAT